MHPIIGSRSLIDVRRHRFSLSRSLAEVFESPGPLGLAVERILDDLHWEQVQSSALLLCANSRIQSSSEH